MNWELSEIFDGTTMASTSTKLTGAPTYRSD